MTRARRAVARVSSTPARGPRSGDALLFLHADTRLPARLRARGGSARCATQRVVGGAFRLRFDSARARAALHRVGRAAAGRALSACPTAIRRCSCGATPCEAIGGIPQVPILEDLDLVRALKRRGRLALLPAGRRHLGASLSGGRPAGAPRCATRPRSLGWSLGVDRARAGDVGAAVSAASVAQAAPQARSGARSAWRRLARYVARHPVYYGVWVAVTLAYTAGFVAVRAARRLGRRSRRHGTAPRRGGAARRVAGRRDRRHGGRALLLAHARLQRRARDRVRAAQRHLRAAAAAAAVVLRALAHRRHHEPLRQRHQRGAPLDGRRPCSTCCRRPSSMRRWSAPC